MADEVRLGSALTAPAAKTRNPIAVPILIVVTLGIYGIYWWYRINREMVDLGRMLNSDGLGDNAGLSLLAVFPGFLLVVPPLVSLYGTVQRIKQAQLATSEWSTIDGGIVVALVVASVFFALPGLAVPGYLQAELNKAWATL